MSDLTPKAVKAALEGATPWNLENGRECLETLRDMAPDLARAYLRLKKVEKAAKRIAALKGEE